MDVRYRSVTEIDPSLKIRIVPVSLIVTDVREEAIWTESYRVGRSFVQSINSLYALREWVRRGRGVPRSDHTMLFSGYDLLGGRSDSSTIGVAFIGTACTYNSVSLIEEYFTGTSGTVSAHELGHSLDAEHDANYRACSDLSANVMSTQAVFPTDPGRLSNPWRFSACSVDAFGAFLETKYLLKNAKESKRINDELDEYDGANGIEAVPGDAPESDGEKHSVLHKKVGLGYNAYKSSLYKLSTVFHDIKNLESDYAF
ncbi:zinc metalloproteinase-disintegrin-like EoMP06 [Elysia marginata]|uniref:Zinc metalloproteinase-disintegrin-like EoMP06 n=1 Tax=Elysia marginata TaxID=1093978 RepID=A0AAV4H4W9_9GAST|nr:zinc metalloproteinase-disintegrin-like EoMP06 [Elysia marginata]